MFIAVTLQKMSYNVIFVSVIASKCSMAQLTRAAEYYGCISAEE